MTILVTGISGYIGSHLAKKAVELGWSVHGVVRDNSNLEMIQSNKLIKKIKLHSVKSGLREILKKVKPDVVFHMATCYIADHRPEQVAQLIDSNIQFGVELLEAMRQEGVGACVVAETTWQYNPQGRVAPVNLYAATKEAFSIINQFYCSAYGLKTIKFKLFDTYGGHDNRVKLFNKLKEVSQTREKMALSKGEQVMDFTHIEDVVDAFILGSRRVLKIKSSVCEEYVITGYRKKMKDWIQLINSFLTQPLPVCLGEKPYRPREVMVPWKTGKKIPGWKCKVSPENGIKKFFLSK